MTCRDVSGFLLEDVAGEIPAHLAGDFQRHVEACQNCRALRAQYEQTIASSRAAFAGEAETMEVPEDVVRLMMQTLPEARKG